MRAEQRATDAEAVKMVGKENRKENRPTAQHQQQSPPGGLKWANSGREIQFIWLPAHVGLEGNELADKYAASATRKREINMAVKHRKSDIKCVITSNINKKWQERWQRGRKGGHLYSLQRTAGDMRESHRSRKEEDRISRTRLYWSHWPEHCTS